MIENIFATCSNNIYEDPELNVASTKLCIAIYIYKPDNRKYQLWTALQRAFVKLQSPGHCGLAMS